MHQIPAVSHASTKSTCMLAYVHACNILKCETPLQMHLLQRLAGLRQGRGRSADVLLRHSSKLAHQLLLPVLRLPHHLCLALQPAVPVFQPACKEN